VYQFIVIRSDKQIILTMARADRHEAQERIEGYERCITSLDEAHFANHSDETVWQKARQGCRDFWFQGGCRQSSRTN
jgi:hypothetical protein